MTRGDNEGMSDQFAGSPEMPNIIRMFKEGKYQELIPLLKEHLARNPDDIQARACLAASYAQTGNKIDAIQEFIKLTELQPDIPVHYFNLGVAYESAENGVKAKECYEKVLTLNPGHQKAQQRLDDVNAKIGQTPDAAPTSDIQLGSWPAGTALDGSPAPPRAVPPPPVYNQSYDPPIPSEVFLMSRPMAPPSGLNWGGFLLPFWWGIAHSAWLWVVVSLFVPLISSIVLLIKGNDIAFENRQFESMEEFESVQKAWTRWGIGVNIFLILGPFLWRYCHV